MIYFREYYTTTKTRDIRKQISEYFTEKYESPVAVQQSKRKVVDEPDDDTDDELYAHMFKRSKVENVSSEFQKYIGMPLSNEKGDPVQFWKSQVNEFPHLSSMARDFLPLQCGSVSVERDFSGAVDLITPTRCALDHKTIRADMCLKSWMKWFFFQFIWFYSLIFVNELNRFIKKYTISEVKRWFRPIGNGFLKTWHKKL